MISWVSYQLLGTTVKGFQLHSVCMKNNGHNLSASNFVVFADKNWTPLPCLHVMTTRFTARVIICFSHLGRHVGDSLLRFTGQNTGRIINKASHVVVGRMVVLVDADSVVTAASLISVTRAFHIARGFAICGRIIRSFAAEALCDVKNTAAHYTMSNIPRNMGLSIARTHVQLNMT